MVRKVLEAEKLRLDGVICLDAETIAYRIAEGHAYQDTGKHMLHIETN